MTRKNYIAIAECIKSELIRNTDRQLSITQIATTTVLLESLTYKIGDVFKADNMYFDRLKFEKACGF